MTAVTVGQDQVTVAVSGDQASVAVSAGMSAAVVAAAIAAQKVLDDAAYPRSRRWVTGLYYGPEADIGTANTLAVLNTLIYFIPFFWPAEPVDRLGIDVTGADAGKSIHLAVLAMKADGTAGDKLVELGTPLSAAAVTPVEGTIAATGPNDWCWMAVASDGAPAVRCITGQVLGMGRRSLGGQSDAARYGTKSAGSLVIPNSPAFIGPAGAGPMPLLRCA